VTSLKRQHFVIGQISACFPLARSPDEAPGKNDHLFFVDSENVTRIVRGDFYKVLKNIGNWRAFGELTSERP
jgi:hypothetical protein